MQINTIIEELKKASEKINDNKLIEIIDEIEKAQNIFVYGTGRSGLMLKAFAMRLMQMNYSVYVIGETITPAIKKGDLLITASASGETSSVINASESAQKTGTRLITIVSDPHSKLAKLQAPTVIIDSPTKYTGAKSSVQPLGSLFEQMLLLLCDAVILKMSLRNINMNKIMADRHASVE